MQPLLLPLCTCGPRSCPAPPKSPSPTHTLLPTHPPTPHPTPQAEVFSHDLSAASHASQRAYQTARSYIKRLRTQRLLPCVTSMRDRPLKDPVIIVGDSCFDYLYDIIAAVRDAPNNGALLGGLGLASGESDPMGVGGGFGAGRRLVVVVCGVNA